MIFGDEYNLYNYLRETEKESLRKAEIRDDEKRMKTELVSDIPETNRLKAHLQRRKERRTKNRWIRYATEFVREIYDAGPVEKDAMRRYLCTARDAVLEMDRRKIQEKKERKASIHARDEKYSLHTLGK